MKCMTKTVKPIIQMLEALKKNERGVLRPLTQPPIYAAKAINAVRLIIQSTSRIQLE